MSLKHYETISFSHSTATKFDINNNDMVGVRSNITTNSMPYGRARRFTEGVVTP
jgi:hypothetical protein